MEDDDRHGWTHPICDDCWWRQEVKYHDDGSLSIRQPHRLRLGEEHPRGGWEQCCRCGAMTTAGIFVRQNDDALAYCPDRRQLPNEAQHPSQPEG